MIDCVVVIPIYKYNLEEYEKHSLYSIFNILQKDYCIAAICGETFDMQKFYNDNNIKNFTFDRVITFDNKYFNSINSYNDLCLTNDLYKAFLNEFEYMLIAQTDCLILSNQLKKFIDKKYYYIGSPIVWPNTVETLIDYPTGRYYNGGFSLRNLEFFNTVTNNKFLIKLPFFSGFLSLLFCLFSFLGSIFFSGTGTSKVSITSTIVGSVPISFFTLITLYSYI